MSSPFFIPVLQLHNYKLVSPVFTRTLWGKYHAVPSKEFISTMNFDRWAYSLFLLNLKASMCVTFWYWEYFTGSFSKISYVCDSKLSISGWKEEKKVLEAVWIRYFSFNTFKCQVEKQIKHLIKVHIRPKLIRYFLRRLLSKK